MSYYILPKIINNVEIIPMSNDNQLNFFISQSLMTYYNKIMEQILSNCILPDDCNDADVSDDDGCKKCSKSNIIANKKINELEQLIKLVHPYEYIYSKVPGSKYSVSKLKTKSGLFYDILEIIINLNIFSQFNTNINSLHISSQHNDSIECCDMIREMYEDKYSHYNSIDYNVIQDLQTQKFEFMFFEVSIEIYNHLNDYITTVIKYLMLILRNQKPNGHTILKLNNLFYKPVIEILYILSSLYEKVYIIKPNTNNVSTFEKYIYCKNFKANIDPIYLRVSFLRLLVFINKLDGKNIQSLIGYNIPYHFKMKIDDINIIIGQQQLDALDLILNLFNNKNKEDKIENLKKYSIQKSVAWCEKFKIPCNKFTEKINIFLPVVNQLEEA